MARMVKLPFMPLVTDAWIAETCHLTRLQRGTYHYLLVLMWRSVEIARADARISLSPRTAIALTTHTALAVKGHRRAAL
jgi:uncharacterized protein YdaU (DUF1376 family)